MEPRKAKYGDFEILLQSASMVWLQVNTVWPIEQCLHDQFLVNYRNILTAGSLVNFVRYDNDTWRRVLEFCPMCVVSCSDASGVEILQQFPIKKQDNGAEGEKGVVVARGFAGKFVIRLNGETHGMKDTLVEANEYAEDLAREKRLPMRLYDAKAKQRQPEPKGRDAMVV
jgi:hypothetical protein